ncbi:MAG: HDIG domain-containing protein [Chthoniobacteraceae bacterium]
MLGFFERNRLVRKGLASAKTRRRRPQNEVLRSMESGVLMKVFIFTCFIVGLWVLINYNVERLAAERFLIALLIFFVALAQLWINHPNSFRSSSRIALMFGSILSQLVITKALIIFAIRGAIDPQMSVLLVPYALSPLICSVLLGKNHGLYAAVFVSLWSSIIYQGSNVAFFQGGNAAVFLVMSLISGFVAVFLTLEVRRRSRLMRAGFSVGLATWALAIAFGLILIPWELFPALDWPTIGWQSFAAIGSGILTAMLVGGALPVLESMFRLTTDISWLEMADLNHPLLKRLTIEAPGTYHHSLVVANLAEAAAEAIGANATMCRVGAYFHDIGKLVKPDYFTENMNQERNPHDDLAPTMSALIIIAHVKEGVDLALKYNLNQQIIDVIQQHHGNSIVNYFYKRALQQQEDARQGGKIMNIREEDIPEVREDSFRYPGPRPQSKEAGIISLADAVESASRSLEKVTPQRLEQLISDIFESRLLDHQLDECELSLKELRQIAESFRFTLQSMMHSRIAYNPAGSQPASLTERGKENKPPVSAA